MLQKTSILTTTLLLSLTAQVTYGQGVSSAEWSSKVWQAASDGNWDAVDGLFNEVPDTNQDFASTLSKQIETYRSHQEKSIQSTISDRDVALTEMKTHLEEEEVLQAMQKAVEAQTLSKNLDTVMFDENVQAVVNRTKKEINGLVKSGNLLTAQTLMYYLRTFYEDTARRDLYERWNARLEEITLEISLLRQYAPKHLHELKAKRAEQLGDDLPEEYNEQVGDNWEERIDGIEPAMLIRAIDVATAEHMNQVSWEVLIASGLKSIRNLGEMPVIAETFTKADDRLLRNMWIDAVDEEIDSLPQYLKHIPGKRVLIQTLERLLLFNDNAMELPVGVIIREFGDGSMKELDKYSAIIWPDESRRFEQQTEGRFVGVGIQIRENENGEIMIVNPIEGSPAYYGGIQPEDVVLKVNGKSASGWSLNDAVDRITGPKGTIVTLTVRRPNHDDPIDFQLTRDSIKLHSVQGWWKKELDDDGQPVWDWMIDKDNNIGYIKLTSFSEESYGDILDAIQEIKSDGHPNGLILDLRYNPGGLLPSARRIANLFVQSGTIVSGETADGEELFNMRALPNRAFLADWPVVILINQGSASASEIVAGCVQAHDAGIIVGQRSWGKGSVQTVHPLSKESSVKLTTQYYRLPSPDGGETPGRLVHKREGSTDWGVVPDVEVRMSPSQISQSNKLRAGADILLVDTVERPNINELLSDGIDPQLETALLILRANALSRIVADHRQAKLD